MSSLLFDLNSTARSTPDCRAKGARQFLIPVLAVQTRTVGTSRGGWLLSANASSRYKPFWPSHWGCFRVLLRIASSASSTQPSHSRPFLSQMRLAMMRTSALRRSAQTACTQPAHQHPSPPQAAQRTSTPSPPSLQGSSWSQLASKPNAASTMQARQAEKGQALRHVSVSTCTARP